MVQEARDRQPAETLQAFLHLLLDIGISRFGGNGVVAKRNSTESEDLSHFHGWCSFEPRGTAVLPPSHKPVSQISHRPTAELMLWLYMDLDVDSGEYTT